MTYPQGRGGIHRRWFKLTTIVLWMQHAPYSTMAAFALWGGPVRPTTTTTTTTTRSSSHSHSSLGTTASSTTATATSPVTEASSSSAAAAALNEEEEKKAGDDIVKTVDVLSLDSIRDTLTRQEETIIFALIERSQYHSNAIVYQKGGFGSLGIPLGSSPPPATHDSKEEREQDELSFMEYMLVGTEAMHCACRRYISPEEHAFFPERLPPNGPMGALPQIHYPQDLLSTKNGASFINFNKVLLQQYVNLIVPQISKCAGDDEQYGSTVLADVAVLQALSRRVHYGKFVAESKYRSNPTAYQRLVDSNDAAGVMELLTNAQVEAKVLRRARIKAATYGTEPILLPSMVPEGSSSPVSYDGDRVLSISDTTSMVAAAAASAVVAALEALGENQTPRGKVDPLEIEKVYRDIIIPLTKVIEVAYLFLRCGRNPPPEYTPPIWPPVPPPSGPMPAASSSS
jgi:chorismate mutase